MDGAAGISNHLLVPSRRYTHTCVQGSRQQKCGSGVRKETNRAVMDSDEEEECTYRSMKDVLRPGVGERSGFCPVDDDVDEHYAGLVELLDRVRPVAKRRALLQRLLQEAVEQDRSATMTALRERTEAAALAEHAAALHELATGTRLAPYASMFCTDDDGLPRGVARQTVTATLANLIVVNEDEGTLAIHDDGREDDVILLPAGLSVECSPTMRTHMYLSHDCDWYSSTGCVEFNEGYGTDPKGNDNDTKNQHMSHGFFEGELYVYVPKEVVHS